MSRTSRVSRVQFDSSHRARSPTYEDANSDSSHSGTEEILQKGPGTDLSANFRAVLQSEDGGKLPKPEGEAGRPGRGGYSLQAALGWPTAEFDALHVR